MNRKLLREDFAAATEGLGRFYLNRADELINGYHADILLGRKNPAILRDIRSQIRAAEGQGMDARTQRRYLEELRLG